MSEILYHCYVTIISNNNPLALKIDVKVMIRACENPVSKMKSKANLKLDCRSGSAYFKAFSISTTQEAAACFEILTFSRLVKNGEEDRV